MLLTFDAATLKMGVPRAALRKESERYWLLVRFGRAVRIDENTIPELIEKCRNEPKARAYTGTNQGAVALSETQADQRLLRAQMTAQLLKKAIALYIATRDTPIGPTAADAMMIADPARIGCAVEALLPFWGS